MTMTAESSCTKLPLEQYPSMNPLALDLIRGLDGAKRFFEPDVENGLASPPKESLAAALLKENRAWGNEVQDEIEAWASGRAGVVIAGQQVGFGGGPLYTLVKLASLVHLKNALGREGRRVVALFWMATEDHDLDEVARLSLWAEGRLREIRAHADPSQRTPVGLLGVPEELRRAVLEVTDLPPEGWLEPGLNLRDSFARLITMVAGGEVILVDSLLPELREAGRGLFATVAGRLDEVQQSIAKRSEELEHSGYRAQVTPAAGGRYTLLYEIDERGERRQIEEAERLRQLSDEDPRAISTAALMRPLLQDAVFSPDVFIGGPAEVAYYAQLGGVYKALGVRQPRVALRSHCLVVPRKLIRGVERHGIEPQEWLDTPQEIVLRREQDRERRLAERIDALKRHFESELDQVRRSILQADPSMTRSLNRTSRRIEYHLATLERRGRRVIARSDRERFEAAERFANAIRPGGVVQDRIVGWLSCWLLWGDKLFESLVSHAEPSCDELKIIGLS